MRKSCETCYHHYHNKHTLTICRHALKCDDHCMWQPYTNADWLRTIRDEKLARFLCSVTADCDECIVSSMCEKGNNGFSRWLDKRREDESESS